MKRIVKIILVVVVVAIVSVAAGSVYMLNYSLGASHRGRDESLERLG